MRRDAVELLVPLLRAVKADKPIPDAWRQPLVEFVMLLLDHPNAETRSRTAHVVIAMVAADQRLEFIDRSQAVALASNSRENAPTRPTG